MKYLLYKVNLLSSSKTPYTRLFMTLSQQHQCNLLTERNVDVYDQLKFSMVGLFSNFWQVILDSQPCKHSDIEVSETRRYDLRVSIVIPEH